MRRVTTGSGAPDMSAAALDSSAQRWITLIEQGNRLFRDQRLEEACEVYLGALAWVQSSLLEWRDQDGAFAAFVITHHNLADLHISLEQPERASEYLCACHAELTQHCCSPVLSPAQHQAALRHSNRSYAALLEFVRDWGTYPPIERLLNRRIAHEGLDFVQDSGHSYH